MYERFPPFYFSCFLLAFQSEELIFGKLKMALSYEEGMSALRAMFPSWDAQILAELLQANEEHLENTIDMVLTMEPPAPSSVAASAAAAPRSTDFDLMSDEEPPPAPPSSSSYAAAASPAPSSSYRKSPSSSPRRKSNATTRSSRVCLPDDFLRLPVDSSYDGHELSEQEQRDAILAEMLQNEIFRQELMQNEEFSAHFNGDRPSRGDRPSLSRTSRGSSVGAYPEKSASEIASETFSAMSVKFASMSEGADGCILVVVAVALTLQCVSNDGPFCAVMKKKANEMYMRFQTRSDAPAEKDPYRCVHISSPSLCDCWHCVHICAVHNRCAIQSSSVNGR